MPYIYVPLHIYDDKILRFCFEFRHVAYIYSSLVQNITDTCTLCIICLIFVQKPCTNEVFWDRSRMDPLLTVAFLLSSLLFVIFGCGSGKWSFHQSFVQIVPTIINNLKHTKSCPWLSTGRRQSTPVQTQRRYHCRWSWGGAVLNPLVAPSHPHHGRGCPTASSTGTGKPSWSLNYRGKSAFRSVLDNEDFQTWLLIGGLLCCWTTRS